MKKSISHIKESVKKGKYEQDKLQKQVSELEAKLINYKNLFSKQLEKFKSKEDKLLHIISNL